jgi:hypothetical protein
MAVMLGPTDNQYGGAELSMLPTPLRGFYRKKPVIVMSGKSIQGERNGQKCSMRMLRLRLRR